jgi:23S rRNA (adenine-N6)-dimethyltransferase
VWGWHRLTDDWAVRVVAAARIRPGQLVLDIGAGEGALTRPLVAAGARVVAVEPHPRRAAVLRQRFTGADVTIVECEAASLTLPRRPFRVVASPPYAISSPLLRMLLAPGSPLVAADLVLQRAVTQRYADRRVPGGPRFDRRFQLRLGQAVPRQAFRPPPRVDSAVLVVRRRARRSA